MTARITIGQTEITAFPEITPGSVGARIDTGAKTSAIWVSRLWESADSLQVVFFGPAHEGYTGRTVKFTEYTETVVASSNGMAQRRYKVKLLVVVGGRRIRAWFTLADRSQQVYPVLIGRNVLRGKFIVDVSLQSKNLHSKEQKRSRLLQEELGE